MLYRLVTISECIVRLTCGNLRSDTDKVEHHFRHFFADLNWKEDAEQLMRKNVYPYDYMDSEDKFIETHLSAIECFTHQSRERELATIATTIHNQFSSL